MKDPNVLETFQAMIGGKFAPLTIMNNEDTDLDSMIITFNTAVSETASKILGEHRQKKKPWVIAEILDLCDRRRELRKKRFEPEGSEKYREVNNSIKRCMKKVTVNWMGEQCSEIEENLRKNNSKRAYHLVKDLTTVQDRSGKCLTEEREILNRWTEYCTELYNHKANGDPSVLDCPQTYTENDHPILRKHSEAAVQLLKKGKSAGVDNIPAVLVYAGGEDVNTALTTICNKIWQTGDWPTLWIRSLVITLPKKGNLQQCQNYQTISLISHPSKAMLKIILNRLKPQAGIVAEKQAGLRAVS